MVGWPHVAQVRFSRPKRPHLKKKQPCRLAIPLVMEQKIAEFSIISIFFFFVLFMGQKGVFGSKNGVSGVFWTECEGSDLKQRKGITTMDYRNKIQSLVSMTLETPPTACVNMALFLWTWPYTYISQHGVFLKPELHLAFCAVGTAK